MVWTSPCGGQTRIAIRTRRGVRGSLFESVSLVSHRPGHPGWLIAWDPLPIRGLFQLQHLPYGHWEAPGVLAGGGSLPAAQDSAALVCPVVVGPETCGLVTGLYFYKSASPFGPMGPGSGPHSAFYFIVVSIWF